MNAVVIGGSSGIGLQIGKDLREKECEVVLVSSTKGKLKKASEEIGARGFTADLSIFSNLKHAAEAISNIFPGLDYLVLCAGIFKENPIEEVTEEDWNQSVDINLKSHFFMIQYLLPLLKKGEGKSIVIISSVLGVYGSSNVPVYSITKGGLVALTKTLSVELARYGIRINSVSPSFVDTPMTREYFENPALKEEMRKLHPLGRLGNPNDVSKTVTFLLSDSSSWITGQNIIIDGGRTSKI